MSRFVCKEIGVDFLIAQHHRKVGLLVEVYFPHIDDGIIYKSCKEWDAEIILKREFKRVWSEAHNSSFGIRLEELRKSRKFCQ
jgi:hypothetical protein